MIATVEPELGGTPRLLMYAHDTYGLGHLRRSLAIAGHLARALPNLSTMLVTGSPMAHSFELPPRVDYVKLPSVTKTGDEQYRARDLDLSPERVVRLRAALIADVASYLKPDIVLVDHAPLGMKGELLPALRTLRRDQPATRIVLGLRDVLDAPRKVRQQWSDQGMYAAIESLYDAVLVYGQRDIFDPVSAYGFPATLTARTHFCGYIQREEPISSAASLRAELGLGPEPIVLVTAGGGGDGLALENACLDALDAISGRSSMQAVIIAGPLMAPEERAHLQARVQAMTGPARLLPFHPDVPGLMRASALVVAMGGYNTLCEIVSAGRPAVIVPRTHPRQEQHIRAEAFAARGLVTMLPPDELTPARLAAAMERALELGPLSATVRGRWDGGGLPRIAAHISRLLPATAAPRRRPAL
ncbi:MAG: glycosyltransferase family protein [Chloroflexota bacterium]